MKARARRLVSIAAVALTVLAVPVFASASSSGEVASEPLYLNAAACPSTRQCTAVDNARREITFDPTSPPTHVSRHTLKTYGQGLSCPSTTFCVVVDGTKTPSRITAFVPKSGNILKAFPIPKAGQVDGLEALACTSVKQCTTVGFEGIEFTFDPTTGTTISNATLQHSAEGFASVACASPTVCKALYQDAAQGFEVTFDPKSGVTNAAGAAPVGGTYLQKLACPSATQCTAVDHYGDEVTFDPNTGEQTGAGEVAIFAGHGRAVATVSCPSVNQCTAADSIGRELTFNPLTGAHGRSHSLGKAAWIESDCPSVHRCTAVRGHGFETAFDPAKGLRTEYKIDH